MGLCSYPDTLGTSCKRRAHDTKSSRQMQVDRDYLRKYQLGSPCLGCCRQLQDSSLDVDKESSVKNLKAPNPSHSSWVGTGF